MFWPRSVQEVHSLGTAESAGAVWMVPCWPQREWNQSMKTIEMTSKKLNCVRKTCPGMHKRMFLPWISQWHKCSPTERLKKSKEEEEEETWQYIKPRLMSWWYPQTLHWIRSFKITLSCELKQRRAHWIFLPQKHSHLPLLPLCHWNEPGANSVLQPVLHL